MNKNPFINASGAAVYIIGIVLLVTRFIDRPEPESSILMPMAMLSLFVLSAAVMGYLFMYEPIKLYFDNKKQEATSFFLKTVGFFALIVLGLLVLLVSTTSL